MPVSKIIDFNADQGQQGAWEPRRHEDADGDNLDWRAASVRDGGSDANELYQCDSAGNIYLAESGDDDEGAAIPITVASKRYWLGGEICMAHDLFLRLAGVASDTLSVNVQLGGSEYGVTTFDYTVDLAGSGDLEKHVRLHRELLGRWCSVTISGDVSSRPEVREITFRYLPHRNKRVNS